MQTLKPGEVKNKFVGRLIVCSKCEGVFQLTEDDIPHEITPWQDAHLNMWQRVLNDKGPTHWIKCPTENCKTEIRFAI